MIRKLALLGTLGLLIAGCGEAKSNSSLLETKIDRVCNNTTRSVALVWTSSTLEAAVVCRDGTTHIVGG